MVIETTLIVSRRDAETFPVIHVRDEYTFDTEQEQRAFTEEFLQWCNERPIPGNQVNGFARKMYQGEAKLMETLDKCHGPDSLWPEKVKVVEEELDVPTFLQ